jgi:hypothetical protein
MRDCEIKIMSQKQSSDSNSIGDMESIVYNDRSPHEEYNTEFHYLRYLETLSLLLKVI